MVMQSFDLQQKLSSQQRADAQISNPATPITATAPLETTKPTEQLWSSNPSNGGIVPTQSEKPQFDIDKLNLGLQMMWRQGKDTSTIDSAYGINVWLSSSELEDKPQFLSANGKDYYLEKKKLSDSMEESNRDKFIQEIGSIDLMKKQPNSGIAIHPNTGGTFEQTTDIADSLMKSWQIMNNKELIADSSIDKFKSAYAAFSTALQQSIKLDPEARTSAIEWPIWDLKMALLPLVWKVKSIIYAQEWWKTSAYNKIDSYEKELLRYEKLYKASSDEIKNTIGNYQNQSNSYAVQYSELTYKSPSINAKTKLNDNKAYQIFLDTMMELNPQMAWKIKQFRDDKSLSWEEREFISTHFEWGTFKELFDMRAEAIKNFWPLAAANFKQYDQIIEVKKLADKDLRNDMMENMKSPVIDPNKLMFYINKWY